MLAAVKRSAEKRVDISGSELAGWQTDVVYHQKRNLFAFRPLVEMLGGPNCRFVTLAVRKNSHQCAFGPFIACWRQQ